MWKGSPVFEGGQVLEAGTVGVGIGGLEVAQVASFGERPGLGGGGREFN